MEDQILPGDTVRLKAEYIARCEAEGIDPPFSGERTVEFIALNGAKPADAHMIQSDDEEDDLYAPVTALERVEDPG